MEKTLQVVVKVTERCNINCTYCYVFNKGNEDFLRHPPAIPIDVVSGFVDFLIQAIRHDNVTSLMLSFHGGEPLLLKKSTFETICRKISLAVIDTECKVAFGVQTNGIVVV